jgi:hypothetical protein
VWEKAKWARIAAEEEEQNVRRAKLASIRSEMARCGFVIVDYSDDKSDLSDEGNVEEKE